jgi:hypothetical protein
LQYINHRDTSKIWSFARQEEKFVGWTQRPKQVSIWVALSYTIMWHLACKTRHTSAMSSAPSSMLPVSQCTPSVTLCLNNTRSLVTITVQNEKWNVKCKKHLHTLKLNNQYISSKIQWQIKTTNGE